MVSAIFAKPVDLEKAQSVATNFWAQNVEVSPNFQVVNSTPEGFFEHIFLFTAEDQDGFILVSADDRALPILGYSFDNNFRSKNIPSNVNFWLQDYENQIKFLIDNNIEPSSIVTAEWNRLADGISSQAAPQGIKDVAPLLTTYWDQSPYYNKMCPMDGSNRSVTGCTATATAQVMKYWNHPTQGHGSHTYVTETLGQTLTADFGATTYLWSSMLSYLGSSSTSAQDDAVATLMYHVGVACEMDYSASGSGASSANYGYPDLACAENALQTYFKYSNKMASTAYAEQTDAEWKTILRNELNAARPVIYTGYDSDAGHCFVCDGYDSNGKFHFNWGWGSYCDGYYSIGQLNPAPGGTGGSSSSSYNIDNRIIVNIEPNYGADIYDDTHITATVNDPAHGSVSGTGTFTNYTTDYPEIVVNTNEGYKFKRWSDGSKYNARYFNCNGGNINLTAEIVPVQGDTLYYCTDDASSAFGSGSGTNYNYYWGIRIPAASLTPNTMLTKVQFYSYYTGTFGLRIYTGGTNAPQTLVQQQTINITSGGWQTYTINNPYAINGTQDLWIVLTCSGSGIYPMTFSQYGGNDDAAWFSNDGGATWDNYLGPGYYYSWMIKGITVPLDGDTYTITTNANNAAYGTTTPAQGVFSAGDEATLTATANSAYKFTGWNDGSIENPRTITVNGDATYTANFERLGTDTLTYCFTTDEVNSLGMASGTIYWAVKFDPSALPADRQITKLLLYDASSASHTFQIYSGGNNAPQTREHNYNLPTTASEKWNGYEFDPPVDFNNTKPLWLVFSASAASHPAAYTHYSGNNNGCLLSTDGSEWDPMTAYDFFGSWMVMMITAPKQDNPGDGDAVDNITLSNDNVFADNANIYVIADANTEVRILDAAGRLIISDTQTQSLQAYGISVPGIYFVQVGNQPSVKVVVR